MMNNKKIRGKRGMMVIIALCMMMTLSTAALAQTAPESRQDICIGRFCQQGARLGRQFGRLSQSCPKQPGRCLDQQEDADAYCEPIRARDGSGAHCAPDDCLGNGSHRGQNAHAGRNRSMSE